jgi:hypothetical protein
MNYGHRTMTATDPDFDALKAGFQRLEARMALQDHLLLRREYRRGIARIQWSMWPLWLGQTLQILLGVACIALGVSVWGTLRDGGALFVSAILVHAYGVLCIILAGLTLGMLARIDRGEPLAQAQLKLAKLRKLYVIGGTTIGLAWWLFWIPFAATLFYWLSSGRVDFYANMGVSITIMLVVGVAGLLATWWFHRWSRSPSRPRMARAMDDAVTGHSLARAQRRLDELKAFAEE